MVSPNKSLDVLEQMLNDVVSIDRLMSRADQTGRTKLTTTPQQLVQTSKALKNSSKEGRASQAQLSQSISTRVHSSVHTFNCALDDLETEIVRPGLHLHSLLSKYVLTSLKGPSQGGIASGSQRVAGQEDAASCTGRRIEAGRPSGTHGHRLGSSSA